MATLLRVRGICASKHEIEEYMTIPLYFLITTKIDILAYAYI